MKKTAFALIESLQTLVHAPEFKEASRFQTTHFPRQRLLRFTVLIGFLLTMRTKPLPIE